MKFFLLAQAAEANASSDNNASDGNFSDANASAEANASGLAEKAPETFAESVDRTVSELFSSGETNDTVGALPTGFKPVEKKEKRKSSLFPLWT